MNPVTIRPTVPAEAELLATIQKAAFRPLYECFHDERNPFLRGAEDILCRLNKSNRYFTILYGNTIVGGIFYRLQGNRGPNVPLAEGEYYLTRIYIHPAYQNQGIASQAILLCEKEFPDANTYYVDFPADLPMNRKCYEKAGYQDTGDVFAEPGSPSLASFRKTVAEHSSPKAVKHPLIYPVDPADLPACLSVIRESFRTVAENFGLTPENCPKHTAFLPLYYLETQMDWGWHLYALYAGKKIIGYMSLSKEGETTYQLHNLAVLPAYRHNGFGTLLLNHAKETVRSLGGTTIQIGIIEESALLKNWYIANGFTPTGTKKYPHLPFTSGYLEWKGTLT